MKPKKMTTALGMYPTKRRMASFGVSGLLSAFVILSFSKSFPGVADFQIQNPIT